MVLWELTLGTAYFLGLKRTYRLGLKIQRKLIPAKNPKIRQFAQRRTRAVFDMALTVHRKIQERDIEVGRNLGNRILRWLDRMKPAAQIRGPTPSSTTKQLKASSNIKAPETPKSGGDPNRHLFSRVKWSKQFTPVSMMMMKSVRPNVTQFRNLTMGGGGPTRSSYTARAEWGSVIRKDMMQWMLQK